MKKSIKINWEKEDQSNPKAEIQSRVFKDAIWSKELTGCNLGMVKKEILTSALRTLCKRIDY
jgi:hypothetical protein